METKLSIVGLKVFLEAKEVFATKIILRIVETFALGVFDEVDGFGVRNFLILPDEPRKCICRVFLYVSHGLHDSVPSFTKQAADKPAQMAVVGNCIYIVCEVYLVETGFRKREFKESRLRVFLYDFA